MEMGLFDHMNPELARMNPLAVVRAFDEEDTQQGSLIEEIAYRYRKNRIHSRFNINFLEYMRLPCTVARKMDEVADQVIRPIEDEENKIKNQALENQMNNLDK
jgi:hypothetical protein